MTRAYVHTIVLEFLLLVSQVLAFKLAAVYWGALGFSEFALTRRAISLLLPAIMLGLGVALPRYASRSPEGDSRTPAGYLQAGALMVVCALVLWLGVLLGGARLTARVIFGDSAYVTLIPAVALSLAGLSAHTVAYGYLRGRLKIRTANWLQLGNVGLLPIAVFLRPGQSVTAFFTHLGLAWLLVGVTVLLVLLQASWPPQPLLPRLKELAGYGVTRVPGEFLQVTLLGLPAILVAHIEGIEAAGYVAFAMSLVNMFGSLFSPVGLVLLPTVSRLAGVGDLKALGVHVRNVIWRVLGAALVAAVAVEAGAALGVRLYLGQEFLSAVPIVRLALLGILPYALFMVLRSVLDAMHERALNTRNLGWATTGFLSGLLVSLWVRGGSVGILGAATGAFYLLGTLTVRDTVRSLRSAHA